MKMLKIMSVVKIECFSDQVAFFRGVGMKKNQKQIEGSGDGNKCLYEKHLSKMRFKGMLHAGFAKGRCGKQYWLIKL